MNKRQVKINEILSSQGEITIHALSEMFGVSEMTIYRDAAQMEKEGLLYKKRGALVYTEREGVNCENTHYMREKRAIAKMAVELIHEGDSIIFDNSTTALEVARLLTKHKNLTVYATNLEVANVLCANPDITLYVSGGYYLNASAGLIGSFTESFVEQIHACKCIIGASGIDKAYGITGPYPHHSSLERKIMMAVDTVIVVSDHSKFGKVAMEKIAPLDLVHYIITDSGADPTSLEKLGGQTKILVAPVMKGRNHP